MGFTASWTACLRRAVQVLVDEAVKTIGEVLHDALCGIWKMTAGHDMMLAAGCNVNGAGTSNQMLCQ